MQKSASNDQRMILASASPRRLELLRQIGIEPAAIDPPEVDEAALAGETPSKYARRMALAKLEIAAARHRGHWILAADTVVACGRRILPKAETVEAAGSCLELLSGRRHRVLGAIAIRNAEGRIGERLVTTIVTFKRMEVAEIRRYLNSQEWKGKAGAYAIQGKAGAFVGAINGSYSNVVGLSLFDVASLLTGLGWKW